MTVLFYELQSEAQFQAAVMQLATAHGWEWMHVRKAMNERGYHRTPVVGSLGAGWPDLVLLKEDRLIFAELKSQKGRLSQQQGEVLALLIRTGHEVFCWRPSDWDSLSEVLAG